MTDKQKLKQARAILKMTDSAAKVMSEMTKEEARKLLQEDGYTDAEIAKLEESVIDDIKNVIGDKKKEPKVAGMPEDGFDDDSDVAPEGDAVSEETLEEKITDGEHVEYGRRFKTKVAKNDDDANEYMTHNKYGVLHVNKDTGEVHMAHMDDEGVKESTISDHILDKNIDAKPEIRNAIYTKVAETLKTMMPEVAKNSFPLDENDNPYISKKWPGKLHKKVDIYHKGVYKASSNAYKSAKDAVAGYAHSQKLDPKELKAHYSKD